MFVLVLTLACTPAEPDVRSGPAPDAPGAGVTPVAVAAPPAAVPPAAAPPAAGTGPIRQAWEALLAGGCAVDTARVYNPVSARVLRNTAYALAGLRFQDVNLRLVFADDGGWYNPTLDQAPALDPDATACVERLKAHEDKLRAALPIPDELAARMTRDHALWVQLRAWEQSSARSPYTRPRFEQTPDGAWQMFTTYADCTPTADIECGGYSVSCPSETPCEATAAG